jgi:hypothetical protein
MWAVNGRASGLVLATLGHRREALPATRARGWEVDRSNRCSAAGRPAVTSRAHTGELTFGTSVRQGIHGVRPAWYMASSAIRSFSVSAGCQNPL